MTVPAPGPDDSGPAIAPSAPGRLGEAAPAPVLAVYLDALGRWVHRRRSELDRVDAASFRADDPDAYAGDLTLSMALWQSVSDRWTTLLRLWDSGRADGVTREQMSQVIWGRRDSVASPAGVPGAASLVSGGLALSVVEAGRLSDALAVALTTRIAFDPSAADGPARLAAVREALERLRHLVAVEPSWAPQVETLAARTNDLATRAARGGDIGAPLKQLETDAARVERDLIVTTASRKQSAREKVRAAEQAARDQQAAAETLARDLRSAADALAALQVREDQARALVARCVSHIAQAPRYAVPEPDVLGPVPSDRAGLDAYLSRLAEVERAMAVVEQAYAKPLADRDELRGRLDAYRVMARRAGRDAEPAVLGAANRAVEMLRELPCDLQAAAGAVDEFTRLIRPAGATGSITSPGVTR